MRYFGFYAEDSDGIYGTDFHVEICELESGVIEVSETHCGRTRGSIWSMPQHYYTDHFWLTVKQFVDMYGGIENISDRRIGCLEQW